MEVVGSSRCLCEEEFAIYWINQYKYRRNNKRGSASFIKKTVVKKSWFRGIGKKIIKHKEGNRRFRSR
jgi:hypothetical protein